MRKNKKPILLITLLCTILFLFYFNFQSFFTRPLNLITNSFNSTFYTTKISLVSIFFSFIPPTEDPNYKFVYTTGGKDENSKSQVWVMDTDGKNKEKLPLQLDFYARLFTRYTKDWLYYTPVDIDSNAYASPLNNLYAYNIKTHKQLTLHLPKDDISNVRTQAEFTISPDNKIIIYTIYQSNTNPAVCPHWTHPIQGCPPIDLYPTYLSGNYSYNIDTQKTVYLGDFGITQWSDDSRYIYTSQGRDYHEYKLANGEYKIDVTTGKVTPIKRMTIANDLYDFSYRDSSGNLFGSQDGFTQFYGQLYKQKINDITPHAYNNSPNADILIFRTSVHLDQDNSTYFLYNRKLGYIKKLYTVKGYNDPEWINNRIFIASKTVNNSTFSVLEDALTGKEVIIPQ